MTQAAVAYTEIAVALFPKFGALLAHGATFPAVMKGNVFHDNGMGDLGDTFLSYSWRDNSSTPHAAPLTAELGIVTVPREEWLDDIREPAPDAYPDDPARRAFGLFGTSTSTTLRSSLYGARPATAMAVEWLEEDLLRLGWLETSLRSPIR